MERTSFGWMRKALVLLSIVLAAPAAAAVGKPPRLLETCLTKAERSRAVAFRASDGVALKGVLLGHGTTGVALAHEYHGDLCRWLPFARVLARKGYLVLAFDARNSGSSAIVNTNAAAAVDRDLRGAVKLLRARGAKRLVLGGASMGGTAALVVGATLRPAPVAVLSLSAPTDFGPMDARPAVRKLTAPTFFLAGKDDTQFAADAQTLYDVSVSTRKRLEIRDTGSHGTDLLRGPDGPATQALVLGFLSG
jgi:alpha-beta hydrolase superfamily lysophospholipase